MKYALFILIFIFWEFCSHFFGLGGNAIPAPSEVIKTAFEMTMSGELAKHLVASLSRVGVGFVLGSTMAIVLAVVSFKGRLLGATVSFTLNLLRPIPPIAWIPIAILWFGLGNKSAIFIVAVGAFFPLFISIFHALSEIPNEFKSVAKSLGATGYKLFRFVELPSIIPAIKTGLQVGLGMSWMSVIAAELVGAQSGLGYVIQSNRLLLNTEKIFVGMAFIGIIGFLMSVLLSKIFDTYTPWLRKQTNTS